MQTIKLKDSNLIIEGRLGGRLTASCKSIEMNVENGKMILTAYVEPNIVYDEELEKNFEECLVS